jgi:hypothetical protein
VIVGAGVELEQWVLAMLGAAVIDGDDWGAVDSHLAQQQSHECADQTHGVVGV